MNEIDELRFLAGLMEEHCELNHGPNTNPEEYPAIDYIVNPFGYKENSITAITLRELVVPVCHECVQALLRDEWTLLYCFECSCSHWVYRRMAKNSYRHHILWLRGCPECTNEFGGLYFNDEQKIPGAANFIASHFHRMAA